MDDFKQSFPEHESSFDSFELQFTSVAKDFLREAAKWAKFLSILGFIGLGFIVIFALAMFAMGGVMSEAMSQVEGGSGAFGAGFGAAMGVVYLLIAVLYFFPIMYLYKFASKTKLAINNSNSQELTAAFENLKSHYKFIGILAIIMLAIYALIIVIAIIAGIGAAAMT